jgi:hypothetical protein
MTLNPMTWLWYGPTRIRDFFYFMKTNRCPEIGDSPTHSFIVKDRVKGMQTHNHPKWITLLCLCPISLGLTYFKTNRPNVVESQIDAAEIRTFFTCWVHCHSHEEPYFE